MIEKYTLRNGANLADAKSHARTSQYWLAGFVGAVGLVALGAGVAFVAFDDGADSAATVPSTAEQIIALTRPADLPVEQDRFDRRSLRYTPANHGIAPAPRPENLPAPVVTVVAAAPPPAEDPLADISLPELEQLVTRSIGSVATAPLNLPTPAPDMTQVAPVVADVATALTVQPAPRSAVAAQPAPPAQPDVVPVAVPVPQVPICLEQLAILSQATVIPFELGAVNPRSEDLDLLRRSAQVLARCDGLMLAVEGHSDASGSDLQNIALSWQRAEAAIAILAAEGYDTARLEPVGYGARRLLDTSGTPEAHALNRRVTLALMPIPGSDMAELLQ